LFESCTVPFGNDTIDARDGEADNVDCGPGEDKVLADAADTVSGCETIERPGAAAPAPGAGPTPAAPAVVAARLALKARLKGRSVLVTGRLTGAECAGAKVRLRLTGRGGRTLARRTVRLSASCGLRTVLRGSGPRRALRVRASTTAAPTRVLKVR
jgi:hypothetical protein